MCLWLLLLGSPPVEFVVKWEQGKYGSVFLHGLTLAHLRQTDVWIVVQKLDWSVFCG